MLKERIGQLLLDKIDFQDDAVESVVEGLLANAMDLSAKADEFEALAATDTLEEVANGIIDLADAFDDAELTPAKKEKVIGAFRKIFNSPTEELEEAGVALFEATLNLGVSARQAADFFDQPDQE